MIKMASRLALAALAILALIGAGFEWAAAIQYQRGKDFFDDKHWLEAKAAFSSSAAIFDRNPDTHRWLAKTYVHLIEGRNSETQIKLLRNAEDELEKALAIESQYPYYWYELALVSQLIEQLGEAPRHPVLDCFHQAVIIDRNNPIFLQHEGQYLVSKGNKEEAKAVLQKLISIDIPSSIVLAQEWINHGYDPSELTEYFSVNQNALIDLSGLLQSPKFLKASREVSQKAYELNPANPRGRMAYAWSFLATGECAKSREILAPLFDNPELQFNAYNTYAFCLYYNQKYEQAAEQYLQLIRLKPDVIDSRSQLANCYLNLNKPELAKEQLVWLASQTEITDQNARASIYLSLAGIFEQEKDLEQEAKYYHLYLAQRPDDKAIAEKLKKLEKSGSGDIIYSPWEMKNEKNE
jgi:tetratricopeptide (TPR) repeat protein